MSVIGKVKRLRRLLKETLIQPRVALTLPANPKPPAKVQETFLFGSAKSMEPSEPSADCNHSKVSVLVLSNDGAPLLEKLLKSFLKRENCRNFEIVVSLQDSRDSSESLLASFAELLDIRILRPDRNLSFSEGVNRLSQLASGDLLLLLNNDFEFAQPAICKSAEYLSDKDVGVCGIPLVDARGRLNQNGINFAFDLKSRGIRPINVESSSPSGIAEVVPSVTGAFLMTRVADFKKLGGLDEGFYFGFEDVDYCLRVIKNLRKRILLIGTLKGMHPDQSSRDKMPSQLKRDSRLSNFELFQKKHGLFLRKALRGTFAPSLIPQTTSIVISAHSASINGGQGDTVVAQFLRRRLAEYGVDACVRGFREDPQPVVPGRTFCLHLVPKSLSRTNKHSSFGTTSLTWIRQWSRVQADDYRLLASNWVWFSGHRFEEDLDQLGITSRRKFLPLGADPELHPIRPLAGVRDIDYLWPANYFKVRRAPQDLTPLPGRHGVAVGNGWDENDLPAFQLEGSVRPDELATYYSRAKVVIDESGQNTLPEASVNLRFWESLAAGALPLSNNQAGISKLFPFDVPTWETPDDLARCIERWCDEDSEREELIGRMRQHLPPAQGLEDAAREILKTTEHLNKKPRVCVLNPAPEKDESHWGDTFLAGEFSSLLQDHDFVSRVLPKEHWNSAGRLEAEVVVVLHGREKAEIHPGQLNIIWIISNPDRLDADYVNAFDEVWVASQRGKKLLHESFGIQAKVIIPGASKVFDTRTAKLDFEGRKKEPLIIGNSLGRVRPSVLALTRAGIRVEVIGEGWEEFIPRAQILGKSISRIDAGKQYCSRRVVISDTREPMRDWGMFPPRVWEAARAGAVPISDVVQELGARVDKVPQWKTVEDLLSLVNKYSLEQASWAEKIANLSGSTMKTTHLEHAAKLAAERIGLLLRGVPTVRQHGRPAEAEQSIT